MKQSLNDPEREDRLRRALDRDGYILRKSPRSDPIPDDQGGYMILETATNLPVYGYKWDLDLDEVEEWTADKQ